MSSNVIASAGDDHCPSCGGSYRAPCDCAFGGSQWATWSEGFPLKLKTTLCTDCFCEALKW